MFNILVVDDEPLICKGLSSLLAASGLDIDHIYTAGSGYEALDCIRMEEIDLLVTDIQMGGYERDRTDAACQNDQALGADDRHLCA
ncbi:response regulator [Paenibacillus rhizoplanae]